MKNQRCVEAVVIPSAFRGRGSQTSSAVRRWRWASPCWRPLCPARSRPHTGSLPRAVCPRRRPRLLSHLHLLFLLLPLPSSPSPRPRTPQAPSICGRTDGENARVMKLSASWFLSPCGFTSLTCTGRRSSPGWRSGRTPPRAGGRTSSPQARIPPCHPGPRSTPPLAVLPAEEQDTQVLSFNSNLVKKKKRKKKVASLPLWVA